MLLHLSIKFTPFCPTFPPFSLIFATLIFMLVKFRLLNLKQHTHQVGRQPESIRPLDNKKKDFFLSDSGKIKQSLTGSKSDALPNKIYFKCKFSTVSSITFIFSILFFFFFPFSCLRGKQKVSGLKFLET